MADEDDDTTDIAITCGAGGCREATTDDIDFETARPVYSSADLVESVEPEPLWSGRRTLQWVNGVAGNWTYSQASITNNTTLSGYLWPATTSWANISNATYSYTATTSTITGNLFAPMTSPVRRATPEEIARMARESQQLLTSMQADRAERVARQAAVETVAARLLKSLLSNEQWECYERYGYFIEQAFSGRRYRIEAHRMGNVYLLHPLGLETAPQVVEFENDGKEAPMASFCLITNDLSVPLNDQLAAQALMIRYDEDDFLRRAHKHYGTLPPEVDLIRDVPHEMVWHPQASGYVRVLV